MPTPNGTRILVNDLIGYLVEKGLADAQHYARIWRMSVVVFIK